MFDDNLLYDLNLRYLSAAKYMVTADPQMAQLKLGLSEFLIQIITNSSLQQLERMAKQDMLCFNFLPNEQQFSNLMDQPNDDILRISVAVTSNLAVCRK